MVQPEHVPIRTPVLVLSMAGVGLRMKLMNIYWQFENRRYTACRAAIKNKKEKSNTSNYRYLQRIYRKKKLLITNGRGNTCPKPSQSSLWVAERERQRQRESKPSPAGILP